MSVTILYMIVKINRELLVRYIGNYREKYILIQLEEKNYFYINYLLLFLIILFVLLW